MHENSAQRNCRQQPMPSAHGSRSCAKAYWEVLSTLLHATTNPAQRHATVASSPKKAGATEDLTGHPEEP
jgi:hypothetical protein